MFSIFLFDHTKAFVGEVAADEPISSNHLIREHAGHELPIVLVNYPESVPGLGTVSKHDTTRPGDDTFFWAALAQFRHEGHIPFVFDEGKRGIARLILSLPLSDSERIEFLSRLVYVPRDRLGDLSRGIRESLGSNKMKAKRSTQKA